MNRFGKSLRNGLASNVFVYTKLETCQGCPETLLSHLEERFFVFGRTEQGFRGTAPNKHFVFVVHKYVACCSVPSLYDRTLSGDRDADLSLTTGKKDDSYKHKSKSVFAKCHFSFVMRLNVNPGPFDNYPGPLGVTRSGRLGDCNKDNSIPATSSRTKHIIVLSILFTSLSDVLYKLMFFCVRL